MLSPSEFLACLLYTSKSDFNYELPEELIAQTPVEPRDSSRLMAIDRSTGEISHRHFYDIADYLNPGDLLVMNDSKVFPARIYGVKRGTGAHVEFLLLKRLSLCLLYTSRCV